MTGPTILNGMGVPMSDAEALCVLYLFDKLGRKRKRDTHTEARRMVLEHFDGDVAKDGILSMELAKPECGSAARIEGVRPIKLGPAPLRCSAVS